MNEAADEMGSQTYLEIEVNAEQTFIVHKVVNRSNRTCISLSLSLSPLVCRLSSGEHLTKELLCFECCSSSLSLSLSPSELRCSCRVGDGISAGTSACLLWSIGGGGEGGDNEAVAAGVLDFFRI